MGAVVVARSDDATEAAERVAIHARIGRKAQAWLRGEGRRDDGRRLPVGHHRSPQSARARSHLDGAGTAPRSGDGRAVERSLAKGRMGSFGLRTDDCQKMYEELSAQGIEFAQPPSTRPYGVEAVMRDNSGNWLVLVEPTEYSGEDFPH